MSRIGKAPIQIPAGVEIKVADSILTVKGPLGELKQDFDSKNIGFKVENGVLQVERYNEENATKSKHGLYRALAYDMVVGVTAGYKKTLIVNGVGWKVAQVGKDLSLSVGFSHLVEFKAVEGVKLTCTSPTEIVVEGINKELVGAVAAKIRAIRKPEPYHGYGIRLSDEVIERKEGKTAGK
ncbi:MAG: 50S ribosomal protein L6 [Clostridia bacterium]|nr:50S ribosomal protein L6 [Clostridia bacterium]